MVRFMFFGWVKPQFLGSVQFRIASGRSHCWFSAVSACGEFLLSVLSPELGKFLWQHVTSHGTASASPWWSLSSERVSISISLNKVSSCWRCNSVKAVWSDEAG
ncbi:hypothetical protein YC2023_115888 [Brassica napus]